MLSSLKDWSRCWESVSSRSKTQQSLGLLEKWLDLWKSHRDQLRLNSVQLNRVDWLRAMALAQSTIQWETCRIFWKFKHPQHKNMPNSCEKYDYMQWNDFDKFTAVFKYEIKYRLYLPLYTHTCTFRISFRFLRGLVCLHEYEI